MKLVELKNNIILELFQKGLVSIGEKIDYSKFSYLYSFYTYLPEYYFAKILGIEYNHFHTHFHTNKEKAIILKNFDYIGLKQYCLSYLQANNLVCENQKITYHDFTKLLSQFPYLNENILAEFLDIKISRIQRLRCNPTMTATILKKEFLVTANENEIINKLLAENLIYPGQLISYQDFKKIHEMFSHINEDRFAYILEINLHALNRIRMNAQRVCILQSKITDYANSKKDEIISELMARNNIYVGEKINYQRFCELYSGYEYINEVLFAEKILELNYSNYMSLKHKNKNAIILKKSNNLTDEKCEKIYNFILTEFKLNEGDKIDYQYFSTMYQLVANIMTERKFAEILGIEIRFDYMKYADERVIIRNGIALQKMYFLNSVLNEARFYTSEELTSIMLNYEVTLEQIITCYINKYKEFNTTEYIEAYNKNQGLFLGRTAMTKEFFQANYNTLFQNAKKLVFCIKNLNLQKFETEDMVQEIMIYFYEKCGDLEINYGNSDLFYKKAFYRARINFLGDVYDTLTKDNPNYLICAESKSFEDNILESTSNNKYYEQLIVLIQNGYSFEEGIEYISKNSNVDKNVIYEQVKKECELKLNLKKNN